MFVIHCIDWGLVMDDEEENLVGIDEVYSDDFQTQVLVSDLSVLVETVDGWLENNEGIDPDFCRYMGMALLSLANQIDRGRFRKRNLKHAKECSIQQRRGFACGVCRWKRRFGCSRNSAVSAARFESGFRERDGQGQHWRGPHSHGGFLKMIVCESGGHANGLTYFIFRFLRRPLL